MCEKIISYTKKRKGTKIEYKKTQAYPEHDVRLDKKYVISCSQDVKECKYQYQHQQYTYCIGK